MTILRPKNKNMKINIYMGSWARLFWCEHFHFFSQVTGHRYAWGPGLICATPKTLRACGNFNWTSYKWTHHDHNQDQEREREWERVQKIIWYESKVDRRGIPGLIKTIWLLRSEDRERSPPFRDGRLPVATLRAPNVANCKAQGAQNKKYDQILNSNLILRVIFNPFPPACNAK